MPRGYITYCFSDWNEKTFSNGVMLMRNGVRTDTAIRHIIPDHWREGTHYYTKPDPDFKKWTYSRCHKRLRRRMEPGDVLFLRTMWRSQEYFVGYFFIKEKTGDPADPILVADKNRSLFLLHFDTPISSGLIMKLNPSATKERAAKYHPNIFAQFLGRESLGLNERRTAFLMRHLHNLSRRQSVKAKSATG